MKLQTRIFYFITASIFLLSCAPKPTLEFDAEKAFDYAEELLSFGPRIPGSSASKEAALYIQKELTQYNWTIEFQEFTYGGTNLRNIIARKNDAAPQILIGTHYDTRIRSDEEQDPDLQKLPVPGANDGTSGTAVLMELARVLQNEDKAVWLVFFDGEDQGNINNWDWSIGAQYFADQMENFPQELIIIDMIGDADLNIYREMNSDISLTDEIWNIANSAGLSDVFIDEEKYTMLDDHLPFIDLGIPSSLLIDFDYPYWHTQADTIDKISAESLGNIGQVLLNLLEIR